MFILQDIEGLDKYQLVVSTVLILAICAFIINIVTLVVGSIFYSLGKKVGLPKFLYLINVVFFLLQFYYFIISN